MFGDLNQCNPVRGGNQIYYDYLTSELVRQMCLKLETYKYRTGCGRYEKTFNVLNFFLKNRYIAKWETIY